MASKTYPINSGLAQYRGKEVLHEGEFYPSGCGGNPWPVSREKLKAYAASYNPQVWPVSTLDFDHEGDWYGGPGNGCITRLYTEEREVEGKGKLLFLLADIANVPHWLAEMIDEGAFPYVSVDAVDAPYHSELWGLSRERCQFYQSEDFYICGLSLMGQRHPGAPHLAPWPERFVEAAEDSGQQPLEVLILTPIAAAEQRPPRVAAQISFHKEERMDPRRFFDINASGGGGGGAGSGTGNPPATNPPDGGKPFLTIGQLSLTAEQFDKAKASLQAGTFEVVELAELDGLSLSISAAKPAPDNDPEKVQMRKQIAELQADKRARAAKEELAEIKASIGLLPCEEPIVAEILSACHEDEQLGSVKLTIRAKDAKGQISEQETSIAGALRMLLATRERPKGGVVTASHESHQPGSQAQQLSGTLSAADKEAAKAIGLTDEEFATFKATKELPARLRQDDGTSQEVNA